VGGMGDILMLLRVGRGERKPLRKLNLNEHPQAGSLSSGIFITRPPALLLFLVVP
jgi:hypothetical protein